MAFRLASSVTATIASGQTVSGAVSLKGVAVGLLIPTLDSANLTFQASDALAGTYRTVKDASGAALTITAGTGDLAVGAVVLEPLTAFAFIKVVASAAQSGGARALVFTVRG